MPTSSLMLNPSKAIKIFDRTVRMTSQKRGKILVADKYRVVLARSMIST